MLKRRHSLYARATLFLLLGGGALLGALAMLSSEMVDRSVDRLLVERIGFARTVGALLEARLQAEVEHLEQRVVPYLAADDREGLAAALRQEVTVTLFGDGAFVLDGDGALRVAVPDGLAALAGHVDLVALVRRADAQGGLAASPLVRVGPAGPPLMAVLTPVRAFGRPARAYVGGVFQPATAGLLRGAAAADRHAGAELELVDAQGVVVASTDPADLFTRGDHDSVLEDAIAARRPFKGRCHSCHVEGQSPPRRATDVLSFAPLPTLDLGLAVYQPEAEVLAPAYDLRRRLAFITGIVALFVLFVGFSVHSVVRPVVRLTRAVQALETDQDGAALPRLGRDEVGALGRALETWRGRMLDSLGQAQASRSQLREALDATRRHLEALEDVAAQSALGADLETILGRGLHHLLATTGASRGALELLYEGQGYRVARGLEPADQDAILARAAAVELDATTGRLTPAGPGRCAVRSAAAPRGVSQRIPSLVLSRLISPHQTEIRAACAAERVDPLTEDRWIHSLLYHLCMSATTRLLRDQDLLRQLQQERYLRGVLRAQEAERSRIARELHDTVAQDLAALRLDLERVAGHVAAGDGHDQLVSLEQRARDTLDTTRRILLDLRLTVLESMGFLPTLQWHLERLQRERGLRGILSVDGEERELDYERAVTLFRIFQESVSNAVQHARAEQIFVTVGFGDDAITLTVEDDGVGFQVPEGEAPTSLAEHAGLGLLGMEERARLLGGTLEVTSRPGEGTTVRVVVPAERVTKARSEGEEAAP